MRHLVTGAGGFVGRRLVARLADAGEEVVGLGRSDAPADFAGAAWRRADLRDTAATVRAVRASDAERVWHLGALANPRACAADPAQAFATNAGGTAAVCAAAGDARVLVVSTAQVYGRRAGRLSEADPPRPVTVYGRSKLAAERAALRLVRDGLHAVVARPFNHSGPGQSPDFVLPALAAELRRAARDGDAARTGNLWPRRDFLHVDDVLDAYALLLERGEPGGVFNVCRGEGTAIGTLLDGLRARLGVDVPQELDPERARPGEPEEIVGDPARIAALGFAPARSVDYLLDATIAPER